MNRQPGAGPPEGRGEDVPAHEEPRPSDAGPGGPAEAAVEAAEFEDGPTPGDYEPL